jgi:hypothetical protein
MSLKEVPSDHDFFDPAYVKQWSDSIIRYRPERKRVFKIFAAEAARLKRALSILELGCGPGFLADALLQNCDIECYTLVDFSPQKPRGSSGRYRFWSWAAARDFSLTRCCKIAISSATPSLTFRRRCSSSAAIAWQDSKRKPFSFN